MLKRLTKIPTSWYLLAVAQTRAAATRDKLLQSATELIRRNGYAATSIDDICRHASVTKGAFFHHFKTKEELVQSCLALWDNLTAAMETAAPFQRARTPKTRVLGYMDFFIAMLDNPNTLKSCLAGTTAQEAADTSPVVRDAANTCFVNARARFQSLLDEALPSSRRKVDTASLAALWTSGIQGSLILYKASRDPAVIRQTLQHLRTYIAGLLPADMPKKKK
jgi:TetR/AcrR family transcriptional repressor of nem operon